MQYVIVYLSDCSVLSRPDLGGQRDEASPRAGPHQIECLFNIRPHHQVLQSFDFFSWPGRILDPSFFHTLLACLRYLEAYWTAPIARAQFYAHPKGSLVPCLFGGLATDVMDFLLVSLQFEASRCLHGRKSVLLPFSLIVFCKPLYQYLFG